MTLRHDFAHARPMFVEDRVSERCAVKVLDVREAEVEVHVHTTTIIIIIVRS